MRLKIQNDKSLLLRKTLSYAILLIFLLFAKNSWAQCSYTLDPTTTLVTANGQSTNNKIVAQYLFVGTEPGATTNKLYFAFREDHANHHTDQVIINGNITSSTRVCHDVATITIDDNNISTSNIYNVPQQGSWHWSVFEFDLTNVTLPVGTVPYTTIGSGGAGFNVSSTMTLVVPTTNVTVTKIWNDNNAVTRPSLQMQVVGTVSGGTPTVLKTQAVTGTGNTWTTTFTDVERFDGTGRPYVHSADEVALSGYCKQISGLSVTNHLLPVITITAPIVCYEQAVTLTATNLPGTYQWQESPISVVNWTNISGQTTYQYSISNVQPVHLTKKYRVKFIPQGLSCEVTSNELQLTLNTNCTASVSITKDGIFNDLSNDNLAQPGETITYTFVVTNTGSVALTNTEIFDPLSGSNTIPIITIGNLAAGESVTRTWSYTITNTDIFTNKGVYNRATAKANSVLGSITSDSTDPTPYIVGSSGYDATRPFHTYVPLRGKSSVISNSMIYQKAK